MSPPEKIKQAETIWRYGPATEYEAPQPTSISVAGSGFNALCRRFWIRDEESAIVEARTKFTSLSESVLDDILPDQSWSAATAGLSKVLDPWLRESSPHSLCRAVIGPAGSGTREAVKGWGEQNSARQIAAPPRDRLFEPQPDWWQAADPDSGGLLVIPELERLYLRHHDGLDLVRSLVKRLWVSPRRVVVGCDSWAWAYLCKTVQIDALFGSPIALMPFDGDALREWFRPRPRGQYLVQTLRENHVLYPCDNGDSGEDRAATGADIFQRIAATSRGIPAVAFALWRQGLCEDEEKGGTQQEGPRPAYPPKSIRVLRLQDLTLPAVPNKVTTREAIILHTLLLHVRLPAAILFRLLPFPVSVVINVLAGLRECGLIEQIEGHWRVTLLGYPAARTYLEAEGLLVDTF